MQIVFNIIALLCLIIIPALHILSALFVSFGKAFTVASLIAHVIMLVPLLYFGAELELIFLLLLISVGIRQLVFLIVGKRGGKFVV